MEFSSFPSEFSRMLNGRSIGDEGVPFETQSSVALFWHRRHGFRHSPCDGHQPFHTLLCAKESSPNVPNPSADRKMQKTERRVFEIANRPGSLRLQNSLRFLKCGHLRVNESSLWRSEEEHKCSCEPQKEPASKRTKRAPRAQQSHTELASWSLTIPL